jgi:hypothetical protein
MRRWNGARKEAGRRSSGWGRKVESGKWKGDLRLLDAEGTDQRFLRINQSMVRSDVPDVVRGRSGLDLPVVAAAAPHLVRLVCLLMVAFPFSLPFPFSSAAASPSATHWSGASWDEARKGAPALPPKPCPCPSEVPPTPRPSPSYLLPIRFSPPILSFGQAEFARVYMQQGWAGEG